MDAVIHSRLVPALLCLVPWLGESAAAGAAAVAGASVAIDLATDPAAVRIDIDEPSDTTDVAVACDFNGDEIQDLVVGANDGGGPDNTRPGAGEVSLLLGRRGAWQGSGSLATRRDVWILGANALDSLGEWLACGDLNADGFDDLVMGAPYASGADRTRTQSGQVQVVFGTAVPPAVIDLRFAPHVDIDGEGPFQYIGRSVTVGDVNGDGFDDVLVDSWSAMDATGTLDVAGRSYLVLGRAEWPARIDLATEADTTIYGRRADDRLSSGQAIGDVDGDGTGDLLIDAMNADGPGTLRGQAGQILVFRGRPFWPRTIDCAMESPDTVLYGADRLDQFGFYKFVTGDLDGDGFEEVIGSSSSADGSAGQRLAGEIRAYEIGPRMPVTVDLRTKADVVITGGEAGDQIGPRMGIGDIDGDGRLDLIYGARGADGPDNARSDCGDIYVLRGRPIQPPTIDLSKDQSDLVVFGARQGAMLFPDVAVDLNGDGLDEIVGLSDPLDGQDATLWIVSPFDRDDDGIAPLRDNCATTFNPAQADRDGDDVGDACDVCPRAWDPHQEDADADGTGDACDTCPDLAAATDADTDADGLGDACDCAPLDGNARQPAEIEGLRLVPGSAGEVRLRWGAARGADLYAVARGRLSDLAAGSRGECRERGLAETTWTDDGAAVTAGDGLFYIIRGQNERCGATRPAGVAIGETPPDAADAFACDSVPYHHARAEAETTLAGTATGGFAATWARDGALETLTEALSPSPPTPPVQRVSLLAHEWWFSVVPGQEVVLHVDAVRAANAEGEDFAFEFSTDGGATWTPLHFGRLPYPGHRRDLAVALPATTSGAVLVRVVDTDHTPGASELDTVFVDAIGVRTRDPIP